MSTMWASDSIEIKRGLYGGDDYMKQFSISPREHTADIINFERKKMSPLTEKSAEIKSRFNRILQLYKKFTQKLVKDENHRILLLKVILLVNAEVQHKVYVI